MALDRCQTLNSVAASALSNALTEKLRDVAIVGYVSWAAEEIGAEAGLLVAPPELRTWVGAVPWPAGERSDMAFQCTDAHDVSRHARRTERPTTLAAVADILRIAAVAILVAGAVVGDTALATLALIEATAAGPARAA